MPSATPLSSTKATVSAVTARARGLSLAIRIALVTVASAVLAVMVAGAVSYPLARSASQQESQNRLEQLTNATVAAVDRRPLPSGDLFPARLVQVLRSEDISVYYVNPGGQLPEFFTAADAAALANGQEIQGERESSEGQVLVSARKLSTGGAIVLTQPVTVTGRFAFAVIGRFAVALAIGVAIAAAFGLLLARRLTRSLRDAADAAKRLGQGERDVQLSVEGPAEIAELAEALNQLRQALTVSEGRQREFLLSVSHELRTPLTAIRGYAEALNDGIVPPADAPRTGGIMQSEADRLDAIVTDLLQLARLDAFDFPVAPAAVDFGEIGKQAVQVWADRCAAEGLRLESELGADELVGYTDPIRVRQIIDNLCANALRVTPQGGAIALTVRSDRPDQVTVEVRDSGPGLTPDDCVVAFEPAELYTRYRGVRQVGTGVGLALVGRLSRRLGGTASAGSAAEGGARFTITVARYLQDPNPASRNPPHVNAT